MRGFVSFGGTYADEAAFGVGSSKNRLRVDLGLEFIQRPHLAELGHRSSGDGHG